MIALDAGGEFDEVRSDLYFIELRVTVNIYLSLATLSTIYGSTAAVQMTAECKLAHQCLGLFDACGSATRLCDTFSGQRCIVFRKQNAFRPRRFAKFIGMMYVVKD